MIGMISTEDDEVNQSNLVMLVDELHDKLVKQGVKTDKEQIEAFLVELKKQ
jgi:hypothetical protein